MKWKTSNKNVFYLLLAYVVILGLARILLSGGIEVDEAEQSYLSRWWLWGYNIQPPLYTWLQTAVFEVLGNHTSVHVFFRMFLLLMSYYGIFRIFSELGKKPEMGLSALIFSVLLLQFSTESLRQTHTVLVTVAAILSILCLIRIHKNPQWKEYVLLGLVLAMGILSKYNFVFFIISLGLSVGLIPSWRKLLFTWKTLLTVFIVVVLVSPHFWWVWQHLDVLMGGANERMSSSNGFEQLPVKIKGLTKLLNNMLAFLSVFLILFIPLHFKKIKETRQNRNEWLSFFEYFFLLSLGQFVLIILFFNANTFPQRWIQPFFIFLPGYCMLKFYPNGIELKEWKLFKRLGYFAGVAIVSVVIVRTAILPILGKPVWLNKPHIQFCEELQPVLKEHEIEVIVTNHILLAGYFRIVYPHFIVITLDPKYALVSEYDSYRNIMFVWSWAWVVGVEDGKGAVPELIQKALEQQEGKKTIEVDMLTYDYQYCPSVKKSSYDYIIKKN